MPVVLVPKHGKLGEGFSKKEILASQEHPGRRVTSKGYQSPAAWIDNLVALRKFIILCSFCRHKFNHRKNHYRRFYVPDMTGRTDGFIVNGKCDACKQETVLLGGGSGYVHEEEYNKTCEEPSSVRRVNARAKHYARSVWLACKN